MTAHEFSFPRIEGGEWPLSGWRGHPVLVVNTASECGYTPQYAQLQELWSRYRDRGLVVLGVPSNDFGQQEPGDDSGIREFCSTSYGVDFPMTGKQKVIGDDAHPFYRWVVEKVGEAGEPRWNFYKYLVGPDGELVGLWPADVPPTDPSVTGSIEEVLADS